MSWCWKSNTTYTASGIYYLKNKSTVSQILFDTAVYLSSTSEIKWWNLTYIKSLKIIYVWEEDAVEIIK